MNIILLEKVRNLGNMGQSVAVKAGYGRNYLIPKKLAVLATPDNVALFEARRAELEKIALEHLKAAKARATALEGKTVTITAQAGVEGKLFGSLGTRDIAIAVEAIGTHVDKSEILLPNGPLRAVGEYDISLQLHSDVVCVIKISVVPE